MLISLPLKVHFILRPIFNPELKDIINNKLAKNGLTQFTRFFDDRIGAFDLQQKMCEASDVSVVAFFLPELPDSLISNAVSISEALHIPIVTTKSITVKVLRKKILKK